jgi:cytochrome bd-type quinol oxidase subunit 1
MFWYCFILGMIFAVATAILCLRMDGKFQLAPDGRFPWFALILGFIWPLTWIIVTIGWVNYRLGRRRV